MTTGRINQVAIFLTHTTNNTSNIKTSGDGQLVPNSSRQKQANVTVVWFGSPNNIRQSGQNRDDRNYYGVPRPI